MFKFVIFSIKVEAVGSRFEVRNYLFPLYLDYKMHELSRMENWDELLVLPIHFCSLPERFVFKKILLNLEID